MEESDWLPIEIRVRKLVKELIQPTIRRTYENKDAIDKLRKNQDTLSQTQSEFSIFTNKVDRKLSEVDEYSRRILEFAANLRNVDAKLVKNKQIADFSFESLSKTTADLEDRLNALDTHTESFNSQVNTLQDSFSVFKKDIHSQINQFNIQNKDSLNKFDFQLRDLTDYRVETISAVSSIRQTLQTLDFNIQKNSFSFQNLKQDFSKLLSDFNSFSQSSQKVFESLNTTFNKSNSRFKTQIDQLRAYIDNNLYVKLNINFTEAFYRVLQDPRAKRNIAQYEFDFISTLEEQLIPEELRQAIQEAKQRSQKLLETPIPPPSEAPQFRHKRPCPSESDPDILIVPKEESSSSSLSANRKDSTPSNKHKSSFRDFTPDIEDLKANVQELKHQIQQVSDLFPPLHQSIDQINTDTTQKLTRFRTSIDENSLFVEKSCQSFRDDLSSNLQTIQQFKADLNTLQQSSTKINETILEQMTLKHTQVDNKHKEIDLLLTSTFNELSSSISQRKRDFNSLSSDFSKLSLKLESLSRSVESVSETSEFNRVSCNSLTELCRINLKMQEQDEFDKKSISLIGQKENKAPRKTVVSIDKKCTGCKNTNTISMFKAACLAYNPSRVSYSNSLFSRMEMIDIQKRLIDKIGDSSDVWSVIDVVKSNRPRSTSTMKQYRTGSIPGSQALLDPHYSETDLPSIPRRPATSMNS